MAGTTIAGRLETIVDEGSTPVDLISAFRTEPGCGNLEIFQNTRIFSRIGPLGALILRQGSLGVGDIHPIV